MGNHSSREQHQHHQPHNHHPITRHNPLRRNKGRLNLTREELDQRCKPSGLYPTCPNWDPRQIRRLIADGKLASRLIGTDHRVHLTDQECPICFLHYTDINTADCCKAAICTECFLQLQVPKMTQSCPFCNGENMTVGVAKKLEDEDVRRREVEEQRVIEKSILEKYGQPSDRREKETTTTTMMSVERQGSSSFGSNLEAELESRSRSRTMSSDLILDGETIAVMSPEERRALEEEVRSQSDHPLWREMSAQAERERERHELEYIQRRMDERNQRRRPMQHLEELFGFPMGMRNVVGREHSSSGGGSGSGSHGNVTLNDRLSIDDLIMLEAAFLWRMRDGAAGGGGGGTARGGTAAATTRASTAPPTRIEATIARRRSSDGRPRHQREAESAFVTNMIRDRDRGQAHRFGSSSFHHAYPIRHAYGFTSRNSEESSLWANLSEENQLEMAIRLSLEEARRRGDVIATNNENVEGNGLGTVDNSRGVEEVEHSTTPQDQESNANRNGEFNGQRESN